MGQDDNLLSLAARFKALGDPTRLRILALLRECCCPVAVEETGEVRPAEEMTAGEVCCRITGADRITSTVSFHLKELRLAGLITVERRGKFMVYGVNRGALEALAAYLDTGDREESDTSSTCCS